MPPCGVSGWSSGRITSSSQLSAPAMRSPMVPPSTTGASSFSRCLSRSITAGRPPASKNSSIRKRPDGLRSTRVGMSRPSRSQSSRSKGTPSRPASARRCTTALVEPPMAPLTLTPFSKASRVRICEMVMPCFTSSTMRMPACSDSTARRLSTAGIEPFIGRPMPMASASEAMVEAVPMVMHEPAERLIAASAASSSALEILPVRYSSSSLNMSVPEPRVRPLKRPLSIGPPETRMVGHVAARRAHQQRRGGLVAAGQQHHAVDRIGADGLLDIHGDEVAEHHGGRPHQRLAEAGHREFEREAAGHQHAALHMLGEIAEVPVAVGQFRPGVADADHRPAVEHFRHEALALHPAARNEAVFAGAGEPLGTAQGSRRLARAVVGGVAHLSHPGDRCVGPQLQR
jgi:hypothetical protein